MRFEEAYTGWQGKRLTQQEAGQLLGVGYVDAAEMQRKSQLAAEIARGIKARRLTQDRPLY